MLTIEIELLGGRYAATAYNDRSRAEWPPHPARFFSALVAALYDNDPVDERERDALLWLEKQPVPPSLDVDLSVTENIGRRKVLDVFVPVNDVSLLGDVEKPLRDARRTLAFLAAEPVTAASAKDLKTATREVENEAKKLGSRLAQQLEIDADPSDKDLAAATALLPERRTRQVRTFPVVFPERSRFAFVWSEQAPPLIRLALDRLCERVTRLGHSSSLVSCMVTDGSATPNLVPDEDGDIVLRAVGPGQLERLDREFARHQGVESRVLPARPQRYARADAKPQRAVYGHSVFADEWILFERVGGARLLSSRGTDLARAFRGALLEQTVAGMLPPGWLSGHREGGGPIDGPHVAFIALPYVGGEFADASVQGCAIVVPRGLTPADRDDLLRRIATWERARGILDGATMELAGEGLPPVRLRRVELSTKSSLNPRTWCRPSTRFATATPIALDRNPGDLRSNQRNAAHRAALEAQRTIADACERIGLPRPVSVEVASAPVLSGGQPVRDFPRWPRNTERTPRVRTHAEIRFAEPVRGPVILGAGRYFGLGLCLPLREEGSP